MKRLLIILLLFLGIASAIKADEKFDSLNYYVQRTSLAYASGDYQDACLCYDNTLRLYKELMGDVSKDTIYASLEDSYAAVLCFQLGDYNEALRLSSEAMEIVRKAYGVNHLKYAESLEHLAAIYSNYGKHNEAIQLEVEALSVKKEKLGTQNDNYARSLGNLAGDYNDIGNYDEAIRLHTEALEIIKQIYGIEHPGYAISLSNLASDYYSKGNYNESLRLDLEAKEIKEKVFGTKHPSYVNTLSNLSATYTKLGNYQEAINLEKEVVRIRKEVLGAEHPDYAKSLSDLATDYFCIGDYKEALKLDLEAKEIIERELGTEHPDYAWVLRNLASGYIFLGNYKEAIKLDLEAKEIIKKVYGTNNPNYATSLNNLALTYSRLGNYQEAINLDKEAIKIRKELLGTEHPDYAASLNNLAEIYVKIGNYNDALRLSSIAVETFRKIYGPDHPNYATSLNNLATTYGVIGNYLEAIRLETEALAVVKNALGSEHPNYARYLNNIASYYSLIGNYDEALELGIEAADINKNILGEEHPDYAQSLGYLSKYHLICGNIKEALRLGIETKRIIKNTMGENHPDYATALSILGSCYYTAGDYDEAIRYAIEVLDIRKRIFGSESLNYATSLSNLAVCLSESEEYNESIPLYRDYISLVQKNVLNTFSGMTSNERQMYWNKFNFSLNQRIPADIIRSGMPDVASMLYDNTALFAKGLLLSTELEMTKLIQESGDDEALQMYSDLRQNRQMLNLQYSKPIAERYLNCDSLERVSNNLERQLVSRVKAFGDYTRNLSITWRDVQSKLKDNDIAIEFLSYPEKDGEINYVALTLCKNDTAPKLTPLFVESKLLETSGYHETYQTAEADSLIWGSLSSRLEGKSNVYFSASGMLHNIGIEYLPSMEGKDCYRLSSTRELVTHTSNETLRSATLYGDIDYDATYAAIESKTPSAIKYYAMNLTKQHRGVFDDRSLDDGVDALPGTRAELNEVSKLMQSRGMLCDTVTGVLASEESFKALSGQRKSLLHISTHGFYYNDKKANNLKPHLRQMLMGDDRPAYAEDQSLLRCGLCFAGANQALQGKSQPSEWQGDGVLNALEIAQTDLRGLDLVVLSACQTALGDIAQGEGVFGLQRGFKKAGAKTLLMSLWKVNDVATKILMVEFYKNYLAGKSKLESLRIAQQYVRNKDENGVKLFDNPHYWAGFILLDALD